MPNAPRDYRGGTHEGVDIYGRADGSNLACGQEVLNARTGWIVRADHEWKTMVLREYEGLTAALKTEENPSYLDRLRGRQVWVRTDDGAVVRYCHLSAIDEGVQVGLKVEQGMRLGAVGNTGTYDGSLGANRNCHLHFEVWPAPEAFLGKGRKPREALALYSRLFETAPK
jgi:murein DD-endopeptidase MepM/ murein hydrolase activator NlpD